MSVVKSGRKSHDFETPRKLKQIRRAVTEMGINGFGYDKERYEARIQKFADSITDFDRKDEIVARMRLKNQQFYSDFTKEEIIETRNIMRRIICEFEIGNSVWPTGISRVAEYKERRLHLDRCIGWLHAIKQELQYIAETLPTDKNKYASISEDIEKAITMVKGVRRAANKYLKIKSKDNM